MNTTSVGTVNLPDGTYTGTMEGYVVTVKVKKSKLSPDELVLDKTHTVAVTFKTKDGVRGFNVPCCIIVENGFAYVS